MSNPYKIGDKIGKFIIIDRKVEDYIQRNGRHRWKTKLLCRCTKCGRKKWYLQENVKRSKCCENFYYNYNLIPNNKIINGIEFLEKTDDVLNGDSIYKCKCFCGNIFYTSLNSVKSGHRKSCGCLIDKSKTNLKKARNKIKNTYVEDTYLLALTQKRKNNISGHKGVYFDKKNNRYYATITFQGKYHYLGSFYDLKKAIKARERAEERYFEPILKKYRNEYKEVKNKEKSR